jgi:hypothetical protein
LLNISDNGFCDSITKCPEGSDFICPKEKPICKEGKCFEDHNKLLVNFIDYFKSIIYFSYQ